MLLHLMSGLTRKEVAATIDYSLSEINHICQSAQRKYGAVSQVHLVAILLRSHILV